MGHEGEKTVKCEKSMEVVVVRGKKQGSGKDKGLGRVRKRQVGECIEKFKKNQGCEKKKKGW